MKKRIKHTILIITIIIFTVIGFLAYNALINLYHIRPEKLKSNQIQVQKNEKSIIINSDIKVEKIPKDKNKEQYDIKLMQSWSTLVNKIEKQVSNVVTVNNTSIVEPNDICKDTKLNQQLVNYTNESTDVGIKPSYQLIQLKCYNYRPQLLGYIFNSKSDLNQSLPFVKSHLERLYNEGSGSPFGLQMDVTANPSRIDSSEGTLTLVTFDNLLFVLPDSNKSSSSRIYYQVLSRFLDKQEIKYTKQDEQLEATLGLYSSVLDIYKAEGSKGIEEQLKTFGTKNEINNATIIANALKNVEKQLNIKLKNTEIQNVYLSKDGIYIIFNYLDEYDYVTKLTKESSTSTKIKLLLKQPHKVLADKYIDYQKDNKNIVNIINNEIWK